jgi:SAM-dependent methyltransferase
MGFHEQAVSAEFTAALEKLERADPGVACLRWMMGPELFFEWAQSIGVSGHSALRDASSPIPPLALRSIVAAAEEEVFLWTGARDIAVFMALFEEHWRPGSGRPARVFDFGCGCGRMSRFLNRARNVVASASDINADHVAWCAANLERVTTKVNGVSPPLPFDDGEFDLAYSLSLFTHLDEAVAAAWLADLARVLAPGGILLLTTHGYPALDIIRDSETHQGMFRKSRDEIIEMTADLPTRKHHFIPYGSDIIDLAKAGASYGNSFIDPAYAAENWNSHGLKVLSHLPGGVRGWQDIFVLRKEG